MPLKINNNYKEKLLGLIAIYAILAILIGYKDLYENIIYRTPFSIFLLLVSIGILTIILKYIHFVFKHDEYNEEDIEPHNRPTVHRFIGIIILILNSLILVTPLAFFGFQYILGGFTPEATKVIQSLMILFIFIGSYGIITDVVAYRYDKELGIMFHLSLVLSAILLSTFVGAISQMNIYVGLVNNFEDLNFVKLVQSASNVALDQHVFRLLVIVLMGPFILSITVTLVFWMFYRSVMNLYKEVTYSLKPRKENTVVIIFFFFMFAISSFVYLRFLNTAYRYLLTSALVLVSGILLFFSLDHFGKSRRTITFWMEIIGYITYFSIFTFTVLWSQGLMEFSLDAMLQIYVMLSSLWLFYRFIRLHVVEAISTVVWEKIEWPTVLLVIMLVVNLSFSFILLPSTVFISVVSLGELGQYINEFTISIIIYLSYLVFIILLMYMLGRRYSIIPDKGEYIFGRLATYFYGFKSEIILVTFSIFSMIIAFLWSAASIVYGYGVQQGNLNISTIIFQSSLFYGGLSSLILSNFKLLSKLPEIAEKKAYEDLREVLERNKNHIIIVGYQWLQKNILFNILDSIERQNLKFLKQIDIILPDFRKSKLLANLVIVDRDVRHAQWTFGDPRGIKIGLCQMEHTTPFKIGRISGHLPIIIGDFSSKIIQNVSGVESALMIITTQKDPELVEMLFPVSREISLEDKLWIIRMISTPRYISSLPSSIYNNLHPFHLSHTLGFYAFTKFKLFYDTVWYLSNIMKKKDDKQNNQEGQKGEKASYPRVLIVGKSNESGRLLFHLFTFLVSEFLGMFHDLEEEKRKEIINNVFKNFLIIGPIDYWDSASTKVDYDRAKDIMCSCDESIDANREEFKDFFEKTIIENMRYWHILYHKYSEHEEEVKIPYVKISPNYYNIRAILECYNPHMIVVAEKDPRVIVDLFYDVITAIWTTIFKRKGLTDRKPILVSVLSRIHPLMSQIDKVTLGNIIDLFSLGLPKEGMINIYDIIINKIRGLTDAILPLVNYKEEDYIKVGAISTSLLLKDIPLSLATSIGFLGGIVPISNQSFHNREYKLDIKYENIRMCKGSSNIYQAEFLAKLVDNDKFNEEFSKHYDDLTKYGKIVKSEGAYQAKLMEFKKAYSKTYSKIVHSIVFSEYVMKGEKISLDDLFEDVKKKSIPVKKAEADRYLRHLINRIGSYNPIDVSIRELYGIDRTFAPIEESTRFWIFEETESKSEGEEKNGDNKNKEENKDSENEKEKEETVKTVLEKPRAKITLNLVSVAGSFSKALFDLNKIRIYDLFKRDNANMWDKDVKYLDLTHIISSFRYPTEELDEDQEKGKSEDEKDKEKNKKKRITSLGGVDFSGTIVSISKHKEKGRERQPIDVFIEDMVIENLKESFVIPHISEKTIDEFLRDLGNIRDRERLPVIKSLIIKPTTALEEKDHMDTWIPYTLSVCKFLNEQMETKGESHMKDISPLSKYFRYISLEINRRILDKEKKIVASDYMVALVPVIKFKGGSETVSNALNNILHNSEYYNSLIRENPEIKGCEKKSDDIVECDSTIMNILKTLVAISSMVNDKDVLINSYFPRLVFSPTLAFLDKLIEESDNYIEGRERRFIKKREIRRFINIHNDLGYSPVVPLAVIPTDMIRGFKNNTYLKLLAKHIMKLDPDKQPYKEYYENARKRLHEEMLKTILNYIVYKPEIEAMEIDENIDASGILNNTIFAVADTEIEKARKDHKNIYKFLKAKITLYKVKSLKQLKEFLLGASKQKEDTEETGFNIEDWKLLEFTLYFPFNPNYKKIIKNIKMKLEDSLRYHRRELLMMDEWWPSICLKRISKRRQHGIMDILDEPLILESELTDALSMIDSEVLIENEYALMGTYIIPIDIREIPGFLPVRAIGELVEMLL